MTKRDIKGGKKEKETQEAKEDNSREREGSFNKLLATPNIV